MSQYIKDSFLASLERCLSSDAFIQAFYDRFLSQSQTVRDRFAHTDMALQGQKLATSLRILGSAVAGEPAGLRELAERAETHGRLQMNITPDMYELWKASILRTASEHDPAWTPDVGQAWVRTVDLAVNYMISRA
jgi:hemoglobin-like flavoprotein